MRYRTLLFDADGTLFDYDGAERRALEATLAGVGHTLRSETREIYRRVNAALWLELETGGIDAFTLRTLRFERLFAELGLPIEGAGVAGERYLRELAAHGDLLAGAEAVLRSLAPAARMALVTNGLADVQRPRLGGSPVASLFEVLTISDELGIAKPDRRILDHTLAALGDPPRGEVLMIGDSLSSDIQGGLNAGVDTCWIAPDGRAAPAEGPIPTHTIRALSELPAIVLG